MSGTALIILDGWGLAPEGPANCVRLARTPVVDRLAAECSSTTLRASGPAVGLPEGQMGNSEVGHMTLGSGRIISMDLVRVGDAVADGSFFDLEPLRAAVAGGNRIHILGLASDGGVHSHLDHMLALGEAAARAGKEFCFHAFTDGRDVSPTSGAGHVRRLAEAGPVATVCGRYFAMDRDRRWERIELAYRAMIDGAGEATADPVAAIEARYAAGETDEFLKPIVTDAPRIEPGDAVLFANFRADRARQITEAMTSPDFDGFDRSAALDLTFVMMTRYRSDFDLPVLFPAEDPRDVLGEVWNRAGVSNLRVAETEKYAHVTYFFNGGREDAFDSETRSLVPSPKVATYDLKPEMSAAEVAEAGIAGVRSGDHQALVLNFANPDMVGHTGVIEAATAACETVDAALGALLAAISECGWSALVTADHGNAECLIDPVSGGPHTAHTTNLVPCWLVGSKRPLRPDGELRDIAPTLLELGEIRAPPAMTGRSLLA
ncbi:MAG: 2,3-bisphosphoglycerate-independent phosphoglycerate mutase [Planctomycetota bacterium]